MLRFFSIPGAHFDQQESATRRQQPDIIDGQVLAPHEVHQHVVEAFQADGLVLQHERNRIGGKEGIGKRERGEHAERRAGAQIQRGRKHRDARAFAAHQSARYVKAVFGQQLVEVVAGDAARDAGKFLADELGVAIAQACQAGIDLAHAAARDE